MAKDKKSVLLYCDLIHTIEKMDNETAGEFFKHYLRYVNDLDPKTDNQIVDLTFESVKQNLKRDLKKWERRADNSRKNGALGGRPPINPKEPSGLINNPTEPEKPVKDTVTVTDIVSVKDKVSKTIEYRESEFLNSLQPFLEEFGKDTLNEFYLYWTEKKPKGRKMLFEMQKTFDVKRRLDRWSKNNFNKKEKSTPKKDASEILKEKYGL